MHEGGERREEVRGGEREEVGGGHAAHRQHVI
jgi:hypothetical protein